MVILIITFVAVAIYAITIFMDLRCKTEKAQFIKTLEGKVSELHRSSILGANYKFEELAPGCSVEKICFWDPSKSATGSDKEIASKLKKVDSRHNFYYYPRDSTLPSVEIKYVDMDSFTGNPYCISVADNKIKMLLEKKEGSSLVSISRIIS